ncbi:MAG: glycerophosphodiester phosphodiesterase family protein [Lapillicoccus sp.]
MSPPVGAAPTPDPGGSSGGPLVLAHRGSSYAVAEHTLGAYRLAVDEGADGLECDVRLTADGELVCLHDRTLLRTGGADGVVSTMSLSELRAVDWGAWKRADGARRTPGDGTLVTLRELVELALGAPHPTGLAIETKHPTRFGGTVERSVAALLMEYGLTGPPEAGKPWVRVMSFSPLAVRRMSSLLPDLRTVLLIGAPLPLPYRRGGLVAGADTAGLDIAILREHPEVVAAQRDRGHEVFVWTVDDENDIALCLDLGVDAIISNRPEIVLDARGKNG